MQLHNPTTLRCANFMPFAIASWRLRRRFCSIVHCPITGARDNARVVIAVELYLNGVQTGREIRWMETENVPIACVTGHLIDSVLKSFFLVERCILAAAHRGDFTRRILVHGCEEHHQRGLYVDR